jgi:hypothetical protein
LVGSALQASEAIGHFGDHGERLDRSEASETIRHERLADPRGTNFREVAVLSFAEGDQVHYVCEAGTLPSGPGVVVDVWVEGERTEPEYVVRLWDGAYHHFNVRAAQSELTLIT